jgi:hypothetical protein
MESKALQQLLFTKVRDSLPPHVSLAEELGELLELSADSVYRRIRGEKPVTLTELKRICERYHLSVDQLLYLENDSVIFRAPGLAGDTTVFADYMKGMMEQFRYFHSFLYLPAGPSSGPGGTGRQVHAGGRRYGRQRRDPVLQQ